MKETGISFCICTYNRSALLQSVLSSFEKNAASLNSADEIIVVDNNSNDETAVVAKQFQSKLPLSYLFEAEQGLSHARNTGLRAFKNSAIVFIDDDITIGDSFISAYRQAFANDTEHGFFGGKIDVDWKNKKPTWFQPNGFPLINGLIVYYDLGADRQRYNKDSLLPYGANFGLRRSLVETVGEFNTELGVKGQEIGRGEETDYFLRALSAGLSGCFISKAFVLHHFSVERFTTRYLYRYGVEKGKATYVKGVDRKVNLVSSLLCAKLFFLRGLLQLLKGSTGNYYQSIINVGIIMGRLSQRRQAEARSRV